MTRCRNATEFLEQLDKIYRSAARVRAHLGQSTEHVDADSPLAERILQDRREYWLECHARNFLIDHILSALNWQLSPSIEAAEYIEANLATEHPPDSALSESPNGNTHEQRRRLDYFGYDHDSDSPLLVVEAKRPRFALCGAESPLAVPDGHPLASLIMTTLAQMAEEEDAATTLNSEWRQALRQLRDYCRSVYAAHDSWPARAVLTNGEWLLLFASPERTFGDPPIHQGTEHWILVFESPALLLRHHEELWRQLEYAAVTRVDRPLAVEQVPFVVDPARIVSCCFGLRVSYTHKRTIYRKAPLISVSPLLFVRSSGSSFIQVECNWEDELPVDGGHDIGKHVKRVTRQAFGLKNDLEARVLHRTIPVLPIETHSSDAAAFHALPFVRRLYHSDGSYFLILTGSLAHFIRCRSDMSACAFHTHARSRSDRVAQREAPVLRSLINPKSYFVDGDEHHCTHRAVHSVKRHPVNEDNRDRCGPRSTQNGGAFCELWGFEEYFCCRQCAFYTICSQSQTYSLPCPDLVQLAPLPPDAAIQ